MPDLPQIEPEAARRATDAIPGIPRDEHGPVFREPWEAQAFAMTLALHDRGVFEWTEWAAMLGAEIEKAQAAGEAVVHGSPGWRWDAEWRRGAFPLGPRVLPCPSS